MLGAAHRGCGQDGGTEICVDRRVQAGVVTHRGLRPDYTQNRCDLVEPGSDREALSRFEQTLACGVCDRINLRSNLRRGRWSKIRVARPRAVEAKWLFRHEKAILYVLA